MPQTRTIAQLQTVNQKTNESQHIPTSPTLLDRRPENDKSKLDDSERGVGTLPGHIKKIQEIDKCKQISRILNICRFLFEILANSRKFSDFPIIVENF